MQRVGPHLLHTGTGRGNRAGISKIRRNCSYAVLIAGIFRTPRVGDAGSNEAGIGPDRLLDGIGDIRILLKEGFGIFTPLPDPLTVIGEP